MERNISMPVSIYALGGLGEVGKNMYCFENDETIVIIDAGVRFPGVEFPGIDYIVPDFTHLKNNRNKVKALVITHGHEDHIGGIPFLVQAINVPVIYAPKLAAALIMSKLEENKLTNRTKIVIYDENSSYKIDKFNVSFFRVTHSIPDSFGVCLDTPEGRIISTGDFKIDLTPIGPDFELHKLAKLGSEGVTLLLSDSTNAENVGYTPSERSVFNAINEAIEGAYGRVIVSTFSSNVSRIQQICESAVRFNRHILIIGRSMEKAVDISRHFGYLNIPDERFIKSSELKKFRANEILILCTGSQGEPMAALSRIANGEHKDVKIVPGDTVVFSSSAIPGNGIMISNIINQLTRNGANVISNAILSDIHSSGHPGQEELKLMLKLVNPKYFMPMHGEYRMLSIHTSLAMQIGIPPENNFILDNGDCLVMCKGRVKLGYPVEHGCTYIDGKDINGLADPVIEDRRILTNDGMYVVAITLDPKSNQIEGDPLIYTCGIINENDKEHMAECLKVVTIAIKEKLMTKTSFGELKYAIKTSLSSYVYRKTRRIPMVIPVIMSKI